MEATTEPMSESAYEYSASLFGGATTRVNRKLMKKFDEDTRWRYQNGAMGYDRSERG